MTFGQLFAQTFPGIKIKENRTCVWIYFLDEVNHYTFRTDWWNTEIEALPDVVRCKDCKHWQKYSDVPNIGNCPLLDQSKRDDWFCAYGEREVK